jgi:hypothetical protein
MSNTLKITIPEGFEVDSFEASTGEIKFKAIPKNIKERIKTFDDVLQENGVEKMVFENNCQDLTTDEVAYKMVKEIVKAFNEGWTPDWTDSNQYKYYPWFKMGSPSGGGFSCDVYGYWRTYSFVGSRLCFKSADLAKHAGQLFESIYKDFLTA